MLVCPSCGKENPDGFAFCGYCAASVEPRSTPPLEERKIVSVLFCDLVDFTATSEHQDPEDVGARIRVYHLRLREEVERYGGTVEKFIGDAIMAVFGAPVAHEDDAERAVRAGLRILDAIADLNEADPGLDLRVRIGINTGEAVVAMGARLERGEGMVTGDVVNTASRIQGAALVNTVVVSEQTYRATDRFFDYEPLEPASVKGKAEPIVLWRARAARSRFGSDVAPTFKTALVGRELEKALLIGTFDRAAQQRSVQLVTVVGEPGVGKTRLISELGAHLDANPEIVRWRHGRCLPYGEGITFWALGEIVKAEAGILDSDPPATAIAKLEGSVPPDETDRQWLLQRLAPLVGVEAASLAERQELFTAWRRFLEDLAATRPTVLVFDDVHWADDALLAFLEHLAEWSQGVPLLVLCAARPELYERRPGWGAGQRNAHTINLSPLSDRETAELVSHLIASGGLSDDLQRAILERAEGNPLYAEEFVRLLADRGSELQTGGNAAPGLPDSVQALIAARLDTLDPERKSLLQDAAVIGKVFWVGALTEINGRERSGVELSLHELVRKELVRPSRTTSMQGESEYTFWHLLIRDVAYGQIPRAERARRHRSAAAWIERQAGGRVEDVAEVLAHHYLQALELVEATGEAELADELARPARHFLALAGERALGLDTVQAETRLARALELTPPNDLDRPAYLVRWADAASQAGHSREAAEALEEALEALRVDANTETIARALQLLSRVALRLGEGRHVALAAEAVDLLEQDGSGEALIAAYGQLANSYAISGEYADAITTADRASDLAEMLDLPEPARAVAYRGFARAYFGDVDGLAEMEHALDLLLQQGVGRDAAIVMNNLAVAGHPLQGPARSLAAFEQAIVFCKQRGLAETEAILEASCPGLLADLGEPAAAVERADRLIAALEPSGVKHAVVELRSVTLMIDLARGTVTNADARPGWLMRAAREMGAADQLVLGLSAAAAAWVEEFPARACALLTELEQAAGTRQTTYYVRHLPGMLRTALRAGDRSLAKRLADGLEPRYPLHQHALDTASAQIAEDSGDPVDAAERYELAAQGWKAFGNVPETAYALLGQGRTVAVQSLARAEPPLSEARSLFASMGYAHARMETERLLEHSHAEPNGSS
jgi:class 3 adenylate cyclase/tetratricopeptide (TPR) repeat protein